MSSDIKELVNKIIGTEDSLLWSLMKEYDTLAYASEIAKKQQEKEGKCGRRFDDLLAGDEEENEDER